MNIERFQIAVHEAGHAIVARAFNRRVKYVAIDGNDGVTATHEFQTVDPADLEDDTVCAMAGHVATRIAHLDWVVPSTALAADMGRVRNNLVLLLGPDHTVRQYRTALRYFMNRTYRTLAARWDQVMLVADELYRAGALTGFTINRLITRARGRK
jgi:hypothetical protein